MTRVLFACWPFEGHVFPQLSVGGGAARRAAPRWGSTPAQSARRDGRARGAWPSSRFGASTGAWQRVHERERADGRPPAVDARPARAAFQALARRESIPGQVADLHRACIERWRRT